MINVERSPLAPPSLSTQKSHRDQDVIDALYQVFKGKCYLTEKRFDSPNEMEVDHFIPQNQQPELVFAWQNLFPIDNKANKQRPKQVPPDGYLNPCDPNDDVENDIIYKVEFGGNFLFRARDGGNIKAVNTAKLLTHLHQDLKQAIRNRHHEVVNAVSLWLHAQKEGSQDEEYEQELVLRTLLSRDSHFTMLMRSIKVVPPEFFD